MGFNGWRNLSVLLLAGAAMVGCNNTPEKSKTIIGQKSGDPPGGIVQQNKGPFAGPGQQVGTANPNPYPRVDPNPNPLVNTQGQGQPFNPQSNQGAPLPLVGGAPPTFAPLPANPGNFQPPPSGINPPANPNLFNQVPSVPNGQFGAGRITQPSTTPPDPNNINIPRPDFDKLR